MSRFAEDRSIAESVVPGARHAGSGDGHLSRRDMAWDASAVAWHDFVRWLRAFSKSVEVEARYLRLQPPRGCLGEARRVVRDLGLDEHLTLVEPVRGADCGTRSGGRVMTGQQERSRRAALSAWLAGAQRALRL
jgi:hypothetical protein